MTKKIFLLSLAGIILFMQLETFFMPVGTDEGMFYHIGQQISQGYLPYRDVWEHKPPVAFYIFAAVLKVSNTNAALILLSLIWSFLTAYCMYLLARELFAEHKAQLAAMLYAVAANIHRFAQGGNHTEVYMVIFVILLYYLAVRFQKTKDLTLLFLAGMSWGIGFQAKPVALFSGVAVGIFILYDWYRNRDTWISLLQRVAVYGCGFLLPNLLLIAYFASQGILKDFIDLNYGYNAMYVTRNNTSTMHMQWIRETILDNMVSIPYLWVLFIPAFMTVCRRLKEPVWLFIFVAFFFDLAGVCLGGKFHGHYWIQLMPVAVLLAVVGYEKLTVRWLKQVVVVLFIVSLIFHAFSTGKQIYKKYILKTPDTFKLAGYYVRERTTKADRIYVNGVNPQVSFHADRMIAWNVETDNILRRLSAEQLKQYEQRMKMHAPKYIVITERPLFFSWQESFLREKYVLETTIQSCEIYRRK